jgi:protein O-mannosyl-transferase
VNVRRLGIVVALAVAAHATSIGNGFVFDDPSAVVSNPSVVGPLSLDRLLHHDFWGRARTDPQSVGTWRPLPTLSFWIDWHLGGGRAWPFHAVNVVLHALAALALALALGRATGDARLGCVAAGLWAILAVNSEAVASIVGRADVMAAGFGFLAWWLWPRSVLGACAAYVAACLCKESAIILPAWLAVAEWILRPNELPGPPPKDGGAEGPVSVRAWAWAALVAAGAVYAAARTVWFAPFSHVQLGLNNNPLLGAAPAVRLWTGMRLLILTLRVMLVPLNLAADYSGFEIRPDRSFAWEPLFGALALVLLVGAALRLRRRDPALAAGLALFVVTWAIVSNIIVTLPTIFAERLLYLPSAGVALVVARLGERLWSRRHALAAALAVPVVVGNLALAVAADRMWHDDLALFAATVEVSPQSPRAWLNYAVQLQKARQRDRAEAAFRQSLRLGLSAKALTGLGALLDELGRPAEAEPHLRAALRLKPDDRASNENAAIFYARHARYADAIAVLAPYAARHPDDAEVAALLAHLEHSRGP